MSRAKVAGLLAIPLAAFGVGGVVFASHQAHAQTPQASQSADKPEPGDQPDKPGQADKQDQQDANEQPGTETKD
jgi:hypothetical protein